MECPVNRGLSEGIVNSLVAMLFLLWFGQRLGNGGAGVV